MILKQYGTILSIMMLLLIAVCGCGRKEQAENKAVDYYQLKGQVVALDPASNLITIAHERIPNFMEAMTMSFNLRDSVLFHGVEVGDSVRGVVARRRPEMWLDSLTVFWKMPASEPSR